MRAVVQRVSSALVTVTSGSTAREVGRIDHGLLVLLGVEHEDGPDDVAYIANKVQGLRIFEDPSDPAGRMSRSVVEVGGGVLVVSQFTLAADTRKGTRPGFSTAAAPEQARVLFDHLLAAARTRHPVVASGRFGADMQVELVNDGPVTFVLDPPV